MSRVPLNQMSSEQLAERFAQLALDQDLAQKMGEQSKVNRL
ncbi:MAG TPA: hypothetical protein VNT30_01640 [Stellaceae bacterium]|nr:hypothetical protein [Stellaceae bacterium]